ncbi:hypothetical protein PR202_gb12962 [Eleusine coracana subsp. coracana]|uniref:Uncharacterized protein n=1 Tax=Eleusine coracana subsp. coracana TaxID=191504 RepID=A0AAV5EP23_ELECO|nr:hypothetical protein PR202_gb12962 [Eleusine coracana subsp. coracana]
MDGKAACQKGIVRRCTILRDGHRGRQVVATVRKEDVIIFFASSKSEEWIQPQCSIAARSGSGCADFKVPRASATEQA